MLDLTLITDTTDPAELYLTYQYLALRYDLAHAELLKLQAEVIQAEKDGVGDREQLLAELEQLDVGHSVLLGWVSAFFAAYTFALRGTETPWLDLPVRSAHGGGPTGEVRPLTPGREKGGHR
jgi:hypothetical protein